MAAPEAKPLQGPSTYTLHYFPFSFYSIIARFACHLGEKLNPATAPRVDVRLVNLHREENLSEDYLALNFKGQVPALTDSSTTLSAPLTDSRDICQWLCAEQPELLPPQHRETIERLMSEFYSFHAQALTVLPEDSKDGIPNQAAAKLEKQDISESHRRQLEIKSVFHDTIYGRMMEPANVEDVESRASSFCREIAALREESKDSGIYLFGDKPTILDAYATTLVARLMDLGRDDLISSSVTREYAFGIINTEEWLRTTLGRPTVWKASLGHVHELSPL